MKVKQRPLWLSSVCFDSFDKKIENKRSFLKTLQPKETNTKEPDVCHFLSTPLRGDARRDSTSMHFFFCRALVTLFSGDALGMAVCISFSVQISMVVYLFGFGLRMGRIL